MLKTEMPDSVEDMADGLGGSLSQERAIIIPSIINTSVRRMYMYDIHSRYPIPLIH